MQAPRIRIEDPVLERLSQITHSSPRSASNVGVLLAKIEAFDESGPSACNIAPEVRCIGQHEVLAIKSGTLYAFAELLQLRNAGVVFHVCEVDYFGDLRRAWNFVYERFGYDDGIPARPPTPYWL